MKSERNSHIVQTYIEGATVQQLCKRYNVTRSRIYQILKKAGVGVRPRQGSGRDLFLGINVSEAVKDALLLEASRRGVSVSSLSSDGLKKMMEECGYPVEAKE